MKQQSNKPITPSVPINSKGGILEVTIFNSKIFCTELNNEPSIVRPIPTISIESSEVYSLEIMYIASIKMDSKTTTNPNTPLLLGRAVNRDVNRMADPPRKICELEALIYNIPMLTVTQAKISIHAKRKSM